VTGREVIWAIEAAVAMDGEELSILLIVDP
jgi:hypothetical protein